MVYLFLRQRERERERERENEWGRSREREGDTESETGSRLWAVSTELDVELKLTNCEIMTWTKVGHLTYWATQAPLFLTFWGNSILFSRVPHQFAFPLAVQKRSSFSASLPTSVVAWVVNFSHSDRCKVVSHCGFDLYFLDDEWCWVFFHVSVSHLWHSFEEMCIHVFSLFINYIICFSGVEFGKLFMDFWY